MYEPFKKSTIYYRKIIPLVKTRFPWYHIKFSGIPGWKHGFIKELEEDLGPKNLQAGTLKVLFKLFGYVILLDSNRAEFWDLPRMIITKASIRIGWMYWAIAIPFGKLYFIPRAIKEKYDTLADRNNLYATLKEGMRTNNVELMMDAMDIMLKLEYSAFKIQFNVVSRSGDRIRYTVTYPHTRVIIRSVNGIQNQVLAAKYHHLLSNEDIEYRKRHLLHRDNMTPEQLEWMENED